MSETDCKFERETVQRIATDGGLLVAAGSVGLRLRNCYEFTHDVARALSADGWGLMLKTIGLSIDQLSFDSVVHFTTGQVAKVVIDAGSDRQLPCWEVRDAHAEHLYVDPNDPQSKAVALSVHEANLAEMRLDLRLILDILTDDKRARTRRPSMIRGIRP